MPSWKVYGMRLKKIHHHVKKKTTSALAKGGKRKLPQLGSQPSHLSCIPTIHTQENGLVYRRKKNISAAVDSRTYRTKPKAMPFLVANGHWHVPVVQKTFRCYEPKFVCIQSTVKIPLSTDWDISKRHFFMSCSNLCNLKATLWVLVFSPT